MSATVPIQASSPADARLSAESTGKTDVLKRLLRLTWIYRGGCVRVIFLQTLLLAIHLGGLSFVGLGIDAIRLMARGEPRPVLGGFGFRIPDHWTSVAYLGVIAALILILGLLRAGIDAWQRVSIARLVHVGLVSDLRSQVYRKLQRMSFRFYDANASGTIINRLTSDVQSVRLFIDGVVLPTFTLLISLAVYLAYMLSIHPALTAAVLSPIPIMWGLTLWFTRSVRADYDESARRMDRLILTLSECVSGIHVVKGFAREKIMIDRFQKANREVRDQRRNLFLRVSLYTPAIHLLADCSLWILDNAGTA
ncbi:MAG: ABC transporter ATP-binding protein, partial [Kiritimatiellia bacterium]|nr:ABC transporter ATP-binding protein [Kiritimatiellia bacterium]